MDAVVLPYSWAAEASGLLRRARNPTRAATASLRCTSNHPAASLRRCIPGVAAYAPIRMIDLQCGKNCGREKRTLADPLLLSPATRLYRLIPIAAHVRLSRRVGSLLLGLPRRNPRRFSTLSVVHGYHDGVQCRESQPQACLSACRMPLRGCGARSRLQVFCILPPSSQAISSVPRPRKRSEQYAAEFSSAEPLPTHEDPVVLHRPRS